MADPGEMIGELGRMMQSVQATQMVTDVVRAYDAYATSAMRALIRELDAPLSAADVAKRAWEIADAMMRERRQRGIGGMDAGTLSPTDAVDGWVAGDGS